MTEDSDGQDSSSDLEGQTRPLSTPKRRCTVPPEIPPGLRASDFEKLSDDRSREHQSMGAHVDLPVSQFDDIHMYDEDTDPRLQGMVAQDRMLVETGLSKLKLSSWEWNDCAVRLGRDRDSLGRTLAFASQMEI